MRDKASGRSRGFGFLTYEDMDSLDRLLENAKHQVDGKVVEVKRAIPRGEVKTLKRKLFIGGCSPSTTSDSLREAFSKFGTILEAQIMKDRFRGRSRGFGFVTFEDDESLQSALSETEHNVDGKLVDVKRAEPKKRSSVSGASAAAEAMMANFSNSSAQSPRGSLAFGAPVLGGFPGHPFALMSYPIVSGPATADYLSAHQHHAAAAAAASMGGYSAAPPGYDTAYMFTPSPYTSPRGSFTLGETDLPTDFAELSMGRRFSHDGFAPAPTGLVNDPSLASNSYLQAPPTYANAASSSGILMGGLHSSDPNISSSNASSTSYPQPMHSPAIHNGHHNGLAHLQLAQAYQPSQMQPPLKQQQPQPSQISSQLQQMQSQSMASLLSARGGSGEGNNGGTIPATMISPPAFLSGPPPPSNAFLTTAQAQQHIQQQVQHQLHLLEFYRLQQQQLQQIQPLSSSHGSHLLVSPDSSPVTSHKGENTQTSSVSESGAPSATETSPPTSSSVNSDSHTNLGEEKNEKASENVQGKDLTKEQKNEKISEPETKSDESRVSQSDASGAGITSNSEKNASSEPSTEESGAKISSEPRVVSTTPLSAVVEPNVSQISKASVIERRTGSSTPIGHIPTPTASPLRGSTIIPPRTSTPVIGAPIVVPSDQQQPMTNIVPKNSSDGKLPADSDSEVKGNPSTTPSNVNSTIPTSRETPQFA